MTPLVIYCDASAPHCDDPNDAARAGWGAVFVRGDKVIDEASGELPRMESVVAEFKAVRLALEHAVRARFTACGTVIVASDCDAVERYLAPRGNLRRKELAALAAGIRRIAAAADVFLVVSWVKGHNGIGDAHSRFNNRADRLAKQASGALPSDEQIARLAAAKQAANDAKMQERSRRAKEQRAARRAKEIAEAEQRRAEQGDSYQRRIARAVARAAELEGRP
jgi:ribonuclease HI